MQDQKEFLLVLIEDYVHELDVILDRKSVPSNEIDRLKRNFFFLKENLLTMKGIGSKLRSIIRLLEFPVLPFLTKGPENVTRYRYSSIVDRDFVKKKNLEMDLIRNFRHELLELHYNVFSFTPEARQ
ncbi:MAG: hypothetical protein LWX56_14495 [Ignavibacteria bacterium]|nr:hypothetical protein [Ignavibacteria bacterium]